MESDRLESLVRRLADGTDLESPVSPIDGESLRALNGLKQQGKSVFLTC